MSNRVLFVIPAIALLTMACGLVSLLPGGKDVQTEVTANGLPEFELDEERVIELVESDQTDTLYDLINEEDQGEMLEPGVQRYTADIRSYDLIDLSTGWCAKNNSIMEDNEEHITGSIQVDDYVIPDGSLVRFVSEVRPGSLKDYPDGLSCYSWDIVASNWPVGTHRVTESWTLDSDLNDGYGDYKAGTYGIEYTVKVTD